MKHRSSSRILCAVLSAGWLWILAAVPAAGQYTPDLCGPALCSMSQCTLSLTAYDLRYQMGMNANCGGGPLGTAGMNPHTTPRVVMGTATGPGASCLWAVNPTVGSLAFCHMTPADGLPVELMEFGVEEEGSSGQR